MADFKGLLKEVKKLIDAEKLKGKINVMEELESVPVHLSIDCGNLDLVDLDVKVEAKNGELYLALDYDEILAKMRKATDVLETMHGYVDVDIDSVPGLRRQAS